MVKKFPELKSRETDPSIQRWQNGVFQSIISERRQAERRSDLGMQEEKRIEPNIGMAFVTRARRGQEIA